MLSYDFQLTHNICCSRLRYTRIPFRKHTRLRTSTPTRTQLHLEATVDKSEGNDANKPDEEEDFFAQCDNVNANAQLENNNISLAPTTVKVMWKQKDTPSLLELKLNLTWLLIPQTVAVYSISNPCCFLCSWRRSPQSRLQLTLELPA